MVVTCSCLFLVFLLPCAGKDGQPLPSKYNLISNVVHEGKAGQQTAAAPYKVHIHRLVEQQWYEVQDLVVADILPQMVALSETYFQVYELGPTAAAVAGGGGAAAAAAEAAAGVE